MTTLRNKNANARTAETGSCRTLARPEVPPQSGRSDFRMEAQEERISIHYIRDSLRASRWQTGCNAMSGEFDCGQVTRRLGVQWHSLCVRSPALRRKSSQRSVGIPPEGGTTNQQHRQIEYHWSATLPLASGHLGERKKRDNQGSPLYRDR